MATNEEYIISPLADRIEFARFPDGRPKWNDLTVDKKTKVTPHHAAGPLDWKGFVRHWGGGNKASANYSIDVNGVITCHVPENKRAWTSSSNWNDQRAVTIEIANCSMAPDWKISDKVMNRAIELTVDICKRWGIEKLEFTGDKNGSLTWHCFYAKTECPGPYFKSYTPTFIKRVNEQLKGKAVEPKTMYRIRKTWEDSKSQIGAYGNLDNAIKACLDGYKVFDDKGQVVYPKAPEKQQEAPNKAELDKLKAEYQKELSNRELTIKGLQAKIELLNKDRANDYIKFNDAYQDITKGVEKMKKLLEEVE